MTEDMDTTRWDMFRLDCPECDQMNGGLAPIKGEEDDPESNRVMCWGCGTVFALEPKRVRQDVERGDTVVRRYGDHSNEWVVERIACDTDTGETLYILSKDSANPDLDVLTAGELAELYEIDT